MMHDEATYYITPGGTEFRLDDAAGKRYLNEVNGLGMAPLRHITRQGVGQHGETHLATLLRPRIVNLKITEAYASRPAMFDGHLAWFEVLAPGDDAGALRKVFPDGRAFELDVRVSAPPDGGQNDRLGTKVQSYVFQLVAHDPVWRGASLLYAVANGTAGSETAVPTDVPTDVGDETLVEDIEIDYAGNWRSHPTIEVDGPLDNLYLTHVERDEVVELLYDIPTGETVTLVCDPDAPSVTDAAGNSLQAFLSDATDLADFYLQPDVNTLRVWGVNMSASTKITVKYYERMIGI